MRQTLLVAWPDDKLAGAVAHDYEANGYCWRWLVPSTLAGVNATISDGLLRVDEHVVNAVLWRVAQDADLSVDFAAADRVFADTEARSFWLAALNLPTLTTTLRPDASLFFSRSGWSYWRGVLRRHSVRLAPLQYGGAIESSNCSWLPYASSELRPALKATTSQMLGTATALVTQAERVLFAGDRQWTEASLDTTAISNIAAAIRTLNDDGLHLGEILVSCDGEIIAVDAFPRIAEVNPVQYLLDAVLRLLNDTPNSR